LTLWKEKSELELGPPPVASLGIISDRVAGSHPHPLGDRPVLFLLLRQHFLDLQSLVRSHLDVSRAQLTGTGGLTIGMTAFTCQNNAAFYLTLKLLSLQLK